jgi:hypothetical protein
VDNTWVAWDNGNGTKFPRLEQTTSIITDVGQGGPFAYSHKSTYIYDPYTFNVTEEHKFHLEGTQLVEDVRTYFAYTNCSDSHIFSKPTDIKVTDAAGNIASRKWMDYDCTTGNMLTEEVCKSDAPSTGCTNRNSGQNAMIYY